MTTAIGRRHTLRALASVVLLAAAATTTMPAAGQAQRESRPVHDFAAVVLRSAGELRIEQRGREALVVEAEPKVLERMVAEVKDGVLYLGMKPGAISTRHPIVYHLSVRHLERLRSEASGDIEVRSLATPSLAVELAGSGDLAFGELRTPRFSLLIAGSASVAIAGGEARRQSVVISGSGSFTAPAFASDEADVSVQGSGDVEVRVRRQLVVRISGSGDVSYLGNPSVRQTVTGAGSVRRSSAG